ncbi:MAG TPA: aldehyde dehydrogenase, partial [Bdellovibrionales bacterium]|nr:aldehyde dehydrogenase [Bdellovibrionales bacterium]
MIPVNLELGGKNALIVMRDADLDLATSAALWGGFSNAGQVCAATSRILVHDSVASEFTELLLKKAALLQAHPEENRPGRMISEKQITVYQSHLADARQRGLSILMGGEFSSDLRSLAPTLISGAGIEESLVFQEESFGPIIALSQFKTPAEAVAACNRSALGLVASVFTRNLSQGRQIAKQLQVGTVMINEVVYAAGLAEAPWGGIKESGMGRTRG